MKIGGREGGLEWMMMRRIIWLISFGRIGVRKKRINSHLDVVVLMFVTGCFDLVV